MLGGQLKHTHLVDLCQSVITKKDIFKDLLNYLYLFLGRDLMKSLRDYAKVR